VPQKTRQPVERGPARDRHREPPGVMLPVLADWAGGSRYSAGAARRRSVPACR
jgi:hypothetical protein